MARDLDGDVRAFGPNLKFREDDLSILDCLKQAKRIMRKALDKSRKASGPYVLAQMKTLGIDQETRGLNVELGAEGEGTGGWLKLNVFPAQLAINATWGLPLGEGSVKYFYCCHTLEHLYFPSEALPLLQHIHRVLEPGGVARLVVPDIGKCLDAYNRKDQDFFEKRKEIWGWAADCKVPLEHFLTYSGGNQFDVSFESHRYGYDFELLKSALERAGFSNIVESSFMGSSHSELNLDSLSPNACAGTGTEHYSLFVEATK